MTGWRISQILSLLQLAPEIIEPVDVPADDLPDGVTERSLREITKLRARADQLATWDRLLRGPNP